MLATQQSGEVKAQQKRLAVCLNRHAELDVLLNKIYADNALGKLPEKRFESLTQTYGQEQSNLEIEIDELQTAVAKNEDDSGRADRFIKLVNRYINFEELTPAMIHEFVEKIVVHEREDKMVHTSPQKVEIHLNFVGEFVIPDTKSEPTAEDIAIEKRRAKDRERYRRNYLKRRAQGYYDKVAIAKPQKAKNPVIETPSAMAM